jgi:hypothetical protein
MILGSRDRWLREFFLHDQTGKSVPADLESRLY